MKKLKIPIVLTESDDVCFGLINVYPEKAQGEDLTSANKFMKYEPLMRTACFYAPEMYEYLFDIVKAYRDYENNKTIEQEVHLDSMIDEAETLLKDMEINYNERVEAMKKF